MFDEEVAYETDIDMLTRLEVAMACAFGFLVGFVWVVAGWVRHRLTGVVE